MANSYVQFKDNRVKIKEALNKRAVAFLYEAKDSLISQTQRNTPTVSGQLKRSFDSDSYVDEEELIAYIGSTLEQALWVEMGTGEYAVNGDGRKGGWYVCADSLDSRTIGLFNYKYKFPIKYGKNGKVFYFIEGTKPRRMLYKAYQSKKNKIQQQAAMIYKEMNNI